MVLQSRPMNIDPLVDAGRHMDLQAAHDRQYWRAFKMLDDEFRRAFKDGPYCMVYTPHDKVEQQSLSHVVRSYIEAHTMAFTTDIVKLLTLAAAGNATQAQAQEVIDTMARSFATHYTNVMNEAGDLNE
jgi:hypothetical protein